MNEKSWVWVGAQTSGTSHIRTGAECEDFAGCVEIKTELGPILVAVVCDGAGSVPFGKEGAIITATGIVRSAKSFFASKNHLNDLTRPVVHDWIDDLRDRISWVAKRRNAVLKDFASTLVAAVASPTDTVIIHVGDGAAVVRDHMKCQWEVPLWPTHGEYASTTSFITDDPEAAFRMDYRSKVDAIALLSDGLERLALSFEIEKAFNPFFDSMIRPLKTSITGRDRALSKELRRFLNSETVCARTDDDKTLILAQRREAVGAAP
jgi:hypothetical protein